MGSRAPRPEDWGKRKWSEITTLEEFFGDDAKNHDPAGLAAGNAILAKRREEIAQRRKQDEEHKAREAARRRRYEENQPENDDEAAEFALDREMEREEAHFAKQERDDAVEFRRRRVAGLDLVSMALQDPSQLDDVLRRALLGRCPCELDEEEFLKKLDGYSRKHHSLKSDIVSVASSVEKCLLLRSAILCKFALCDGRIPDDFRAEQKDLALDPNAAVEAMYREQQRLERTQDPLERARAAVRDDFDLRGRSFATQILAEFNAAEQEGREADPEAVWEAIRPKDPPQWVEEISASGQDYGFTFYSTQEVFEDRRTALERWRAACEGKGDCEPEHDIGFHTGVYYVTSSPRLLLRHLHVDWVTDMHPSEQNNSAIRRNFRGHRRRSTNPRILNNVFVVVSSDCVFPELDTQDVLKEQPHHPLIPLPRRPGKVRPQDLPNFFVWVYDAEWEPPVMGFSPTEHIDPDKSDNDGYQGRVKVNVNVLFTWFYYAVLEGYDLKDLWSRAQTLPQQVWVAERNMVTLAGPRQLI